jgi:hypothetical protein
LFSLPPTTQPRKFLAEKIAANRTRDAQAEAAIREVADECAMHDPWLKKHADVIRRAVSA